MLLFIFFSRMKCMQDIYQNITFQSLKKPDLENRWSINGQSFRGSKRQIN